MIFARYGRSVIYFISDILVAMTFMSKRKCDIVVTFYFEINILKHVFYDVHQP